MDTKKGFDDFESASHGVTKEPCPKCNSSDNLARWPDGHAHCFTPNCNYHEHEKDAEVVLEEVASKKGLIAVDYKALLKRGISEATCRFFSYGVGRYKGRPVQVAQYRDKAGTIVAQKLRFADKTFAWLGSKKKVHGLFGQHLFGKGKMLTITEGELDALSVAEVEECKWPVVSLPDGAQSAKKELAKATEFLENFDKIVLMFDMDTHGQEAAQEAAIVLPPGKVVIANLGDYKDANECLLAQQSDLIVKSKWNAKPFRPDGLVFGEDLWPILSEKDTNSKVMYPWSGLNESLHGIRKREIVTLTAGSGTGKSSVVKEIAHWLITKNKKVGVISLEESIKRTVKGIVGIHLNKPLHLDTTEVTDEELKRGFDEILGTNNIVLYDHFGSMNPDKILGQMRYMVNGCGCEYLIFDHLSILISGLGEGGERILIDKTMTEFRSFVEETESGLILVTHLKRPQGKGHEEGAPTSLGQLRGSHGIAQLSDAVIGLERDQQHSSEALRNIMKVRVLKNRYKGSSGVATYLVYSPEDGRLKEMDIEVAEELFDGKEFSDLGFKKETEDVFVAAEEEGNEF